MLTVFKGPPEVVETKTSPKRSKCTPETKKKDPCFQGPYEKLQAYGFTDTLTVFARPPVVAETTTVVAAAGFVDVTVNVA